MDNALQAMFSWQFLLFSLTIFTIIWFLRTIVEYFVPKIVSNMLWTNLILPITPILIGALIGYEAIQYPFPDGLTSMSARLMFGAVSGMFSGLVYQVAKGMLRGTIQQYLNGTVIGQIIQPAPLPPIIQPVPQPPVAQTTTVTTTVLTPTQPSISDDGMGTGQP